ncbi:Cof-type HAD-IIB family hydrolase [Vagococcus xieshaowenii]|uniref:Cof-type HAD-IIB family hydrolase n=1 Tax=Vagococcus xieshaowenii TaxID=2562451 RepID=A0AAJ5EFF5_9ENTE|nr:Cof-type HAD-IIB family hydrolase [Vagococcus xieshaowenii]QCA27963.1 Cof-type HAD-IIB family hydrolase [Vagococcus xieshaowenii]TFZ41287.1 Cof-type HAD-IIB family hydrolase [Vagococcus xieshaowenii]
MTRKLIAFDIDGTILDSNKQPLPSTLAALKQLREDGHMLMIATGRSYLFAKEVIESLGFDHYILCNGAGAFVNHQQVYKNILEPNDLKRFIELTKEMAIDTAALNLTIIKRNTDFKPGIMDDAMRSFGQEIPEFDEHFYHENDIYQALAYYDKTLDGYFDQDFPQFRFVRWHENSVDVVPHNGSKAATIMHVAEQFGFKKEDTIAFGDGLNDFEMLQTVGTGVAMGNAEDEVKAIATMVTDTNDNDGIAKALQQLGLI